MDKMELPKNDKELKQLLKQLGRTDEQIEAIEDFGKLIKATENNDNDTIQRLKTKWKK